MTRLKALSDELAATQATLERLHGERNDCIIALRAEGWSLDRLAAAAGVTKSRMQQLVNKLEGK